MTPTKPPRIATWILTRVARENDALVGDLMEEYARRQSAAWYWNQVLHTAVVRLPRTAILVLLVVALYVAGTFISIPGARQVLQSLMAQAATGPGPSQLFSVFFLGSGQMSWGGVFTLGINPYISAAFLVLIVQRLWNWLNRNVEHRRRRPIVRVTWCVALFLCITQAAGFAAFLERVSLSSPNPIVQNPGWMFRMAALLTMTAGTTCLMLISDSISRHQMGNGMFIVFLAATFTAIPGILRPLLSGAIDPVAIVGVTAINTAIAWAVSYGYQRAIVREQAS